MPNLQKTKITLDDRFDFICLILFWNILQRGRVSHDHKTQQLCLNLVLWFSKLVFCNTFWFIVKQPFRLVSRQWCSTVQQLCCWCWWRCCLFLLQSTINPVDGIYQPPPATPEDNTTMPTQTTAPTGSQHLSSLLVFKLSDLFSSATFTCTLGRLLRSDLFVRI